MMRPLLVVSFLVLLAMATVPAAEAQGGGLYRSHWWYHHSEPPQPLVVGEPGLLHVVFTGTCALGYGAPDPSQFDGRETLTFEASTDLEPVQVSVPSKEVVVNHAAEDCVRGITYRVQAVVEVVLTEPMTASQRGNLMLKMDPSWGHPTIFKQVVEIGLDGSLDVIHPDTVVLDGNGATSFDLALTNHYNTAVRYVPNLQLQGLIGTQPVSVPQVIEPGETIVAPIDIRVADAAGRTGILAVNIEIISAYDPDMVLERYEALVVIEGANASAPLSVDVQEAAGPSLLPALILVGLAAVALWRRP